MAGQNHVQVQIESGEMRAHITLSQISESSVYFQNYLAPCGQNRGEIDLELWFFFMAQVSGSLRLHFISLMFTLW